MRRFRFRLDRVLNLRRQEEDLKRYELSNLQAEFAAQLQTVRDMEGRINQLEEMMLAQRNSLKISELRCFGGVLSELRESLKKERGILSELKEQLEVKRGELVLASRRKKVLKRLKQRQFSRYTEELFRRKQQKIDELAASRAAGRRNGNCG